MAPEAVRAVDWPAQMVAGTAVALTTGNGLTLTDTVFDPVQPKEVPVTVYIVADVGETVTVVPLKDPGIHV